MQVVSDTIHFSEHTKRSIDSNTYKGFNATKAINRIAEIENEYFNAFPNGVSKYYGTNWRKRAETKWPNETISNYEKYLNRLSGIKPDSMHCTIYAVEALKAGFDSTFEEIQMHHKNIWKDREYAGWSIGHILTKYYNWKAYLIISEKSNEYERCMRSYSKDSVYDVWYQPDIKLSGIFIIEKDKEEIEALFGQHQFGWGFSDQGWHTWITRYQDLKECNWEGAPGNEFDAGGKSLFLKTRFTSYFDYYSHVVVFPPIKSQN